MNTPIEFESAHPCCCRAGARTTIRVNRGIGVRSLRSRYRGLEEGCRAGLLATDNSFIESFNGKLRSEGLNTHSFPNLTTHGRKWRIGGGTTANSG
jgi:hypothetical protein